MSEPRYNDADTAEPGTVEAVEQQYEVELAGLNDNEQNQVHEALTEAQFNDGLDDVNIQDEVQDAQLAEEQRELAEDFRVDQAKAAEAGDIAGAKEFAQGAEVHINNANQEHGADLDTAAHEVTHQVQTLSDAQAQQDTAETFEAAADDYSDPGQEQAAQTSLDVADDAYNAAEDNVDQADLGGSYGDQSVNPDA